MSNNVYTEYCDPLWGRAIFVTAAESSDTYSVRVRTDWKPDPEVGLAIEFLQRRDGEVLDLGANIGTWCIPVCLASKKKFVAFEALPSNVELMQLAIEANALDDHMILHEVAIWDFDTTLKFSGSSAYGVVDDAGNISVTARSLDSLFDDGLIRSPSLVKMDIEGCELRAINGGIRLLERFHPDIIFEGNGAHCVSNGYFPQDIIRQLELMGYSIYMIVNNRLVLASSVMFQPFGLINYLATRKRIDSVGRFRAWSIPDSVISEKVDIALNKMKPGYRLFMIRQMESGRFEIPKDVEYSIRKCAD